MTPGQRHDSTQLRPVLDAIRVPRDAPEAEHPAHHPERADQRERRASRPGRKPTFDPEAYRRRNVVERCVNKLKQWRRVAMRYGKRATNERAVIVIVIAAPMLWLHA